MDRGRDPRFVEHEINRPATAEDANPYRDWRPAPRRRRRWPARALGWLLVLVALGFALFGMARDGRTNVPKPPTIEEVVTLMSVKEQEAIARAGEHDKSGERVADQLTFLDPDPQLERAEP